MWTAVAVAAGILLVAAMVAAQRAGFRFAYLVLLVLLLAGAGVIAWQGWEITSYWLTFVCTVLTVSLLVAVFGAVRRRRREASGDSGKE